MQVTKKIFSYMSTKERLLFGFSIFVRLTLVGLDLAGLALVGAAVSLLSGTSIAANSLTGRLVVLIESFGISNSYAAVGFMAVFFFIAKAALSVALNYYLAAYVSRIESKKATWMFGNIFQAPIDVVERWTSREISHAVIGSSQNAFGGTLTSVSILAGEVALMLGIAAFLAFVDFQLFIVVAGYLTLVAVILGRIMNRPVRKLSKIADDASIESQSISGESIENFRQIRVNGNANNFVTKFAVTRASLSKSSAMLSIWAVMPRYVIETAMMLGVGLLALQRSLDPASGPVPATLAMFLAGIFRIVSSMITSQGTVASLSQIGETARLALEVADKVGLRPNSSSSADGEGFGSVLRNPTSVVNGYDIVLKEIGYNFPGSEKGVLDGIDLRIPAGEFVAFVGKSGSGKSTLADIILGLRTPSKGKVTFLDRTGMARTAVPKLAYVPQSSKLFSGTLKENIVMGYELQNIDYQRLNEALEAADLASTIASLPLGLDTPLLKGGQSLSGGQIQRVGIARAFYQAPNVVIFDESTSALDRETESVVRESIYNLRGKATVIVIAHSERVIADADRVFTLKNGKIVRESYPK